MLKKLLVIKQVQLKVVLYQMVLNLNYKTYIKLDNLAQAFMILLFFLKSKKNLVVEFV